MGDGPWVRVRIKITSTRTSGKPFRNKCIISSGMGHKWFWPPVLFLRARTLLEIVFQNHYIKEIHIPQPYFKGTHVSAYLSSQLVPQKKGEKENQTDLERQRKTEVYLMLINSLLSVSATFPFFLILLSPSTESGSYTPYQQGAI